MARQRTLTTFGLIALLAAACGPGGGSSTAPSNAATQAPSQAAVATPEPTEDQCTAANLPTLTAGKLTVSTDNPAYPPYYIPDDPKPANSEWELGQPTNGKGLESATAYAIADWLGYTKDQVTWVVSAGFNATVAPGDKPFDIYLTQVSDLPERHDAVDLSEGYFDLSQAVIAVKDTPIAAVTTVAGLKDFKLGAQLGTTSYQYIVDQIAPTKEPAVFDTNDAAIQALQGGQIDGIVADLYTGFYMRDAQLDNGVIVGSLPTVPGADVEHFSVLLQKGSKLTSCINEAIEALKQDGSLDVIRDEWIGGQGAPELQ
jgi:polar amino acid transport system substrate-binding protein